MAEFELLVQTWADSPRVVFRLQDNEGVYLTAHEVQLKSEQAADWEGIFDTRRYVERFQGKMILPDGKIATQEDLLRHIGVFLGQTVLGPEIMGHLAGVQERTLLVHLQQATEDKLAAAFAPRPLGDRPVPPRMLPAAGNGAGSTDKDR